MRDDGEKVVAKFITCHPLLIVQNKTVHVKEGKPCHSRCSFVRVNKGMNESDSFDEKRYFRLVTGTLLLTARFRHDKLHLDTSPNFTGSHGILVIVV